MSPYSVRYSPEAQKTISTLDKSIALLIRGAIETKLMVNPTVFGKPLRYSLKNQRTLRVGEWRITFEIKGSTVTLVSIFHRSKGY